MSELAADVFVNFLLLLVCSLLFAPLGVPVEWCAAFGAVLTAPLWIVTFEDLIQATRRRR